MPARACVELCSHSPHCVGVSRGSGCVEMFSGSGDDSARVLSSLEEKDDPASSASVMGRSVPVLCGSIRFIPPSNDSANAVQVPRICSVNIALR